MTNSPIESSNKASEATDAFAPSEGIGISTPLVSVIMPLYNAEKYVAEAIESVLAQTYAHWELIIVNDGSTDGSMEVAKRYQSEKVQVYSQENRGQCAANNYGYQFAKGSYIKFFDADDILSQNMLAEQVKIANGQKNALVSSAWGRFWNNDINTFRLAKENVWQDMNPLDWLLTSWRHAQPMMQSALWLIPREILNKSGLWDEKLSLINDFDFFTRVILTSEQILFSPNTVLYYRSGNAGVLSAQKSRKAVESAFLSIDLGTSTLLKHTRSESAKLCCANIWQGFVYEFYHQHPDLVYKAQDKIKALGGSDIPFPCGGYTKVLEMLLGWKWASWVKIKLNK